jgi:hypothetical protein
VTIRDKPTIRDELWVRERLGKPDLFMGATTPAMRCAELRAYLLGHDLADVSAGIRNGVSLCWRDVFGLLYGEPLGEAL